MPGAQPRVFAALGTPWLSPSRGPGPPRSARHPRRQGRYRAATRCPCGPPLTPAGVEHEGGLSVRWPSVDASGGGPPRSLSQPRTFRYEKAPPEPRCRYHFGARGASLVDAEVGLPRPDQRLAITRVCGIPDTAAYRLCRADGSRARCCYLCYSSCCCGARATGPNAKLRSSRRHPSFLGYGRGPSSRSSP